MKTIIVCMISLIFIAGCQQKDDTKLPYQLPQAPVQSLDELRMLQDIVRTDPKNIGAWIKLGNIYMDTSRPGEAVQAYSKALELDPKNVDVRVDMGTCYRYTGRSDLAVAEYRKAIEINPDHVNAHKNLGVVLAYDMRDYAGAVKEFEKALSLAPNAPDAEQVRQEIQKLKSMK